MIELESIPMPSQDEPVGSEKRKLQDWALLLIAGRLTGDHLRQGVEVPQLSRRVANGGFASALKDACEQIRPNVTKEASVLLELTAVERRLSRLIAERSYRQI